MKYFFETRLGETRYRLADGSLLCKDVPVARTGKQLYGAADLPNLIPDAFGEIVVSRSPEHVFTPATLASFEGMSITVLHPEDENGNVQLVNPANWKELAVGHLQNVRRGTGDQSDLMIADIIIKDEYAIQMVEDGLRQVSCGYDAEYEQTEPGKAEQVEITGNHVALVPKGRAGNRCAIGDRDTMANQKKNWWTRMRAAIKTGDADTMNELVESAPASVTGDEGDLPQGVNLNINLSPQHPLPDKDPEMGSTKTGDGDDDVVTLLKALLAKLSAGPTGDNDNPDDKKGPTVDGEDDEEEAVITGDSAYRAEVILPGVDLSRKMKPTAFKREVLSTADKKLVRQVVGDADIRKLPKQSVEMAFNAVSELAKGRNTRTATGDASRATITTPNISDLNKANADFWAKKG
ncbi:bacteriophage protein [Enterobacter cancerogenus]|uniref:Bacteriophage protein n=1 Tax=Enterobacter cancerogenus TaxID=69218 RepID=A0A484Z8Q2_9ENTR|nr:bacteriophage protein [Enterobacter cancerogenus]